MKMPSMTALMSLYLNGEIDRSILSMFYGKMLVRIETLAPLSTKPCDLKLDCIDGNDNVSSS